MLSCLGNMAAWMVRACSLWYGLALLAVLTTVIPQTNGNIGCTEVKHAYKSKGFDVSEVPFVAITGQHLKICPPGFTCCTQNMEKQLAQQSVEDYDKLVEGVTEFLQNTFRSRTQKFDHFFTELLAKAKRDLHNMFVRTYGLLYQRNSFVFMDLFNDLLNYYSGKDMNLSDVLDKFFTVLMQKMFELINNQYQFERSYLTCVTEYMDELKPFGDVPGVLSHQVKRAFIAARTFVQGLAIGRDVIYAVAKVQPTEPCKKALMRMMYCPHCRGLPSFKPCNNYCLNIMKGCLAYQAELNTEWNNYIDALMLLAERLEGPFNIESVVDPINVKISDAIMNFQEKSADVSSKVFAGCGQPRLSGRKKRDASDGVGGQGGNHEEYPFHDWKYRNRESRPTTAAGTSLDRLVRDIKGKVKLAKGFWANMSYSICNDDKVAAPPSQEDRCWNGMGKAKYMPEIMKDGIMHQNNNPEVDVDINKPNSIINQQILQLRNVISKLKNAYNGFDVDWIDITDSTGSGSGEPEVSGSGSGNGPDNGGEYYFPSYTSPPERPYNPENNHAIHVRHNTGAATCQRGSLLVVTIALVLMFKFW